MGCSSTTSKICLSVIGFLFWGAAAALIFVGAWVFHTYHNFDELTRASLTLIPAGIIIIVGVFLFILGCIGCVAACKENKCLLAVFFAVLLIVLTAEITAGVLGYVFRDDMNKAVHDGLKDAIQNYNNETKNAQTDQVDYLQREVKCCGLVNASDWESAWAKTNWNHTGVPASCCRQNVTLAQCDPSSPIKSNYNIYKNGCYNELEKKFHKNLVSIAAIAIVFAVIQLLGMLSSCILMCRSQEVRYEMLGGPNSGLRV